VNELLFALVAQPQPAGAASCAAQAMPLLLMFAVFYFLLIRPQQKRQRQLQEMLSRLKKGDVVLTQGGLIGTIHALADQELVLEVADRVRVRVVRAQVTLYQPTEAPAAGGAERASPEKKDK
jgi:preprotein translocase subunit YajC